MSCVKCKESTWIQIDGTEYCKAHGEVKIAEKRIEEERRANPPVQTATDGLFYLKMKHQGSYVTIRGTLYTMEIMNDEPRNERIGGIKMMPAQRLKLELAPSEIRRWTNDPDDIPLFITPPKDAA